MKRSSPRYVSVVVSGKNQRHLKLKRIKLRYDQAFVHSSAQRRDQYFDYAFPDVDSAGKGDGPVILPDESLSQQNIAVFVFPCADFFQEFRILGIGRNGKQEREQNEKYFHESPFRLKILFCSGSISRSSMRL